MGLDKKELIKTLQSQGINDKSVLKAIETVPCETFINNPQKAYENVPLKPGKE